MKIVALHICFALILASCREQKDKTMIPVEKNNGIGHGAPSLDSLLDQQNDTLQKKQQPKDTL